MKLDRSTQEQASTPKHTPKDVGPKSPAPQSGRKTLIVRASARMQPRKVSSR